ncbi:M23 family metallopeptidase [Erythrobacter insulae]|uniref:M23 family metallopeptidase n=1 Tax=Erythrobacter insulae TaxID=2584124 RepID=A0A547PAS0_9SPHN|nr:M23 family metallopeptidase [Erythrobacter insulae]TRD11239.1 M23 family metallopeptidase [Erythrobacter insulae]
MNTLFKRSISKVAAGVFAAASLIAAAPAAANTSANAASNASSAADITQTIDEGKAEGLASGDPRFRQLFASWTALDRAGPGSPVTEQPVVSVPSRMPLAGAKLTSGYGMRNHPVLRRRARHKGVDLAAPTGTPVYATADGIIERADWFSSYGLYISIDHGSDLETRYAHMSKLAVAAGDTVRKGDVIGYVGSTGRSTGPHLHYEVRLDGVAVNPIPYMVETEAQVALSDDTQLTGRGGQ